MSVEIREAAIESARSARVDDIVLSVHSDITRIEQIWRELERTVPISIYQRYDWILPWCNHAAAAMMMEPAVVLGSRRGRPVFLLPFGRRHGRLGIEISWLGCSHVNIGMGLFEPSFAASLDRPLTRQLFRRIGAALRPADFLALHNQPLAWAGADNPMHHLGGTSADQPVLAIALNADFKSMLNARKKKKLRWQENALAKVGGYRFYRAADRAEAKAILIEFLAQKEDQFTRQGIDNVFAGSGPAEFFRSMITQSIDSPDPVIQLYGVAIDGKIRATFAGGVHQGRMHGYFSGIAVDEYVRVSPGELLLYHLVRECCESGCTVLDLGVGEERYKAAWSPVRERQFATYTPFTMKGRALAAIYGLRHAIKLRVRQNEKAWNVAKKVRRLRAKLAPQRNRDAD